MQKMEIKQKEIKVTYEWHVDGKIQKFGTSRVAPGVNESSHL